MAAQEWLRVSHSSTVSDSRCINAKKASLPNEPLSLAFVSAFKVSGNSSHGQLRLSLVYIGNIFEKFLCCRTFQNLDLLPVPIEKDFAIFRCPVGKHFLIKSVSLVYLLLDKSSSPSFVGTAHWFISVELVYHAEISRRDTGTSFSHFLCSLDSFISDVYEVGPRYMQK